MRKTEAEALLAAASKDLAEKEERLRRSVMLTHISREHRSDFYVLSLKGKDGAHAVFQIIGEAGLAALRPDARELAEERTELEEVRNLVWHHIEEWYRRAREGDVHQRRNAANFLKRVGAVLAGDRRGMRTNLGVEPVEVVYDYRRNLLRVQRARELLKQLTGWSRPIRIARVAEACRIPLETLQQHLSVSGADEGPVRPLAIRQTARIWTAQMHKITEQTVSNLVSGLTTGRRQRSRK
jgi:hypothetical protein